MARYGSKTNHATYDPGRKLWKYSRPIAPRYQAAMKCGATLYRPIHDANGQTLRDKDKDRGQAISLAYELRAWDDAKLDQLDAMTPVELADFPGFDDQLIRRAKTLPMLRTIEAWGSKIDHHAAAARVASVVGGNIVAGTHEGMSLATPAGQALFHADMEAFYAARMEGAVAAAHAFQAPRIAVGAAGIDPALKHLAVTVEQTEIANGVMTVFDLWVAYKGGDNFKGDRTETKRYLTKFLNWLLANGGDKPWFKVTKGDARRWAKALDADGLSPSNQQDHLKRVSAAFSGAGKREVDNLADDWVNPFDKVKPPVQMGEKIDPKFKKWSPRELALLFKTAACMPADARDWAGEAWGGSKHVHAVKVLEVRLHSILRIEDILSVQKPDVTREHGRVIVNVRKGKNAQSRRGVVLHKDIAEEFYTWAQSQPTDDLFATFGPMDNRAQWFSTHFVKLREAAGIANPDHTRDFYTFRHTATQLVNELDGVEDSMKLALGGRKTGKVAFDVYGNEQHAASMGKVIDRIDPMGKRSLAKAA